MKEKLQTAFLTRQYMLSKDFELYYYNDRNLPEVALHTHNYYEFYFFLEGDVSIQAGEKVYPLRFGDIIVFPPGLAHRPIIRDRRIPYRRFVLWISREYYSRLLSMSADYDYLFTYVQRTATYVFHNDRISFNTIQSMLLRLLEELHADRFGRGMRITLCIDDLILHLNRMIYERSHPKMPDTAQPLYRHIAAYIEDHLEEPLTLDSLSAAFFVNKYHISHLFKENLGMSVHQYITKKRLALCRDAILAGTSISEVCRRFGFGDYSSFYRAFKKEYGISPKVYRGSLGLPPG